MSKSGGNYVNSQFVTMEAADNGFAEGIALDVSGFVSEGSGENVFLIRRGVIYTPPQTASILDSLPDEFVVFHDFHPRSPSGERTPSNMDHIVVGPTGVFVVDTQVAV